MRKAANIDVPNPHAEAATLEQMYVVTEDAYSTDAGGVTYIKIYTDGSCREGDIKDLARAGWGVFVAPNSPHNYAAPLDGPVQTSYRAELKAILHVLRHVINPTMIMCDCQSVVKTFTSYLEDGVKPESIKEQDLWDQIVILADGLTTKQLCIQWMPSHLEEEKMQKKKIIMRNAAKH